MAALVNHKALPMFIHVIWREAPSLWFPSGIKEVITTPLSCAILLKTETYTLCINVHLGYNSDCEADASGCNQDWDDLRSLLLLLDLRDTINSSAKVCNLAEVSAWSVSASLCFPCCSQPNSPLTSGRCRAVWARVCWTWSPPRLRRVQLGGSGAAWSSGPAGPADRPPRRPGPASGWSHRSGSGWSEDKEADETGFCFVRLKSIEKKCSNMQRSNVYSLSTMRNEHRQRRYDSDTFKLDECIISLIRLNWC